MVFRASNEAVDRLPEDGSFWDSHRRCYRKVALNAGLLVKEWDGRKWEAVLVWSKERSNWVATSMLDDQDSLDETLPQSLMADINAGGRFEARARAWLDENKNLLLASVGQDDHPASWETDGDNNDGDDDALEVKERKEKAWRNWLLANSALTMKEGILAMKVIARFPFPGDDASLGGSLFKGPRAEGRRARAAVAIEHQQDWERRWDEEDEDMLIDTEASEAEHKHASDEYAQGELPPEPRGCTVLPANGDPEYLQIQRELELAWNQPEQRRWSTKQPVGVKANDTEFLHHFNGQIQPSVAERLRHLSNYLADEDVDRCRYWDRDIKEAREYLKAIRAIPMSDKTLELLAEVEAKIQVHDNYEEWHTKTPGLPIVPEGDEALPPFARSGRHANIRTDPRKVLHRAPQAVNDLPKGFKRWASHIQELRNSQLLLWTEEGVSEVEISLALQEQKAFDGAIDTGVSWPCSDNARDVPEQYALERGQRRAALQACLRMLDNVENKAVQTSWVRVVPPVTAVELNAARKSALGPFFTPVALTREHIERQTGRNNAKWHPHGMPYTKRMNRFWREWNQWWDEARKKTETQRHKAKSETEPDAHNNVRVKSVALPLPRSVYADVVTSQESYDRGLMGLCSTIVKMLERTKLVAPRPLIDTCLETYAIGYDRKQPPEEIQWRDVDREGRQWRPVNVIELGFLRMLSTRSITPKMLRRLNDRGAMYLVFADRLQRILDDLSEDNIFEARDTAVSVETLLKEMHKGVDSLNQRTRFSVNDACSWLDRLQGEGRIRFSRSIKELGYVRRPLANVHPEYQISHVPSRGDARFQGSKTFMNEFDAVMAPRPGDMVTIEEVVVSRAPEFWTDQEEVKWAESERARRPCDMRSYPEEPQERLVRPAVRNYFMVLAYRLGYTVRMLEKRLLPRPLSKQDMSLAMTSWMHTKGEWDMALEGSPDEMNRPTTFVRVCAEVEKGKPVPKTQEDAVKLIGRKIMDEAEANLNSLYPTSFKTYMAEDGSKVTLPIRDDIWDWGAPEIRGRARQYFSLGRWPPHLQTRTIQENMSKDRDLDPEILYDPCAEDLTEARWLQKKAEPFRFEDTQIKEGGHGYWLGDTKRQKEYLEELVTNKFAEALMGSQPPKKGILSRLSGLFPSASRPSTAANEDESDPALESLVARLPTPSPVVDDVIAMDIDT